MTTHGCFTVRIRPTGSYADVWISYYIIVFVHFLQRWIFRKWNVEVWTGTSWLRIGTGECGNEPLGSIKCGEFF